MKRISVQAYEDRNLAEGGHAVLLLDGVLSVPERLTIRLRPADASLAGSDGEEWDGGEIRPIENRVTAQGVELVIGPEVAEDPALLPGTVMEIEIPEADLRGEFLWPHITPRMRPKRKNIASNRMRRDARGGDGPSRTGIAATEEGHTAPLATAESEIIIEAEAAAGHEDAEKNGTPANGASQHQPGSLSRSGSGLRPSGGLIEAHLKALKNATSVPALPLSMTVNDSGRSIVPIDRNTTVQALQPVAVTQASNTKMPAASSPETANGAGHTGSGAGGLAPPLIDPHGAHVNLSTSIVLDGDPNDPREPTAEQNPWAWRKDVTALLSTKFLAMGRPVSEIEREGHSNAAAVHRPAARNGAGPAAGLDQTAKPVSRNVESKPVWTATAARAALPANWTAYAMALGPALVLGALALQFSGTLPIATGATPTAAQSPADSSNLFAAVPPAGTFSAPSPVEASKAVSEMLPGSLFDAISVGSVSPRGAPSEGISSAKALEKANASLTAEGSNRDPDEGAFWLKRYITGMIGEERNMRVVTQLGSLYAEPAGHAPDFEKARTLWEITSAAGDPVAMCFLGQLHENGLGVGMDRKVALQWYEKSKQAGGCKSVDDAIARVRN